MPVVDYWGFVAFGSSGSVRPAVTGAGQRRFQSHTPAHPSDTVRHTATTYPVQAENAVSSHGVEGFQTSHFTNHYFAVHIHAG